MKNAILGNALAAIIPALLLDLHGNLIYANQRAARLLQVPEGEFHPVGDDKQIHYNDVIGRQVGLPWPVLCELLSAGGNACVDMHCDNRLWIQWQLVPAEGYFLLTGTDNRHMQKDLFRANKQLNMLNKSLVNQNQQLEDFAHITSHNLRAPIANLKALMQMHNDSEVQEEREQYLSLLQEVILKIDETLNDLVDVVQIRKDLDVVREQLYFAERLQHVKDVLLVDIEKSGIHLTTNFEEAPVMEFPRLYLDSILQNLITNAIRYRTLEHRPRLHLKSWKENGNTMLTAEDNGLGIDMERFGHKLFGFRKTFHKNKDAKGIGLYITKTQVEAMGGSIRAESTPGQGTKFIITFKTE